MSTTNRYCDALGIEVPDLSVAKNRRDANYYAMLIVVLLERGEAVTLQEAAQRFSEAGVADYDAALTSLKRCRPGRPPIYFDGDSYALDPHDDEANLWAFRLGLRPPKIAPSPSSQPDPTPLPSVDSPLTVALLDEAWKNGFPHNSSAQRLALCVLDAYAKPMSPHDVISFVSARGWSGYLTQESAKYWRTNAAVRVRDDGLWEINPEHAALQSARQSVIDRIKTARRWSHQRTDPEVIAAHIEESDRRREAHAQQLAGMRRVLIHAFPTEEPEVLVVIDIASRDTASYTGDEIPAAVKKLVDFDIIAAVNVRTLLRSLGFDPGPRRLGELSPSQKTMKINRRGRTLKITNSLLVQSSCGINRPFGDPKTMQQHLREGKITKLRRRVVADAKSLYALYQYGRLHGYVRLCHGAIDEHLPAPWVHRDEERLHGLKDRALVSGGPLEVVIGTAPTWTTPWSRTELAHLARRGLDPRWWLVDEDGYLIDEDDIQLARLANEDEIQDPGSILFWQQHGYRA